MYNTPRGGVSRARRCVLRSTGPGPGAAALRGSALWAGPEISTAEYWVLSGRDARGAPVTWPGACWAAGWAGRRKVLGAMLEVLAGFGGCTGPPPERVGGGALT